MSELLSTWAPSTIPTSTTLHSVSTGCESNLLVSLTSAIARAKTETDAYELITLSRVARGAEASLTIISAEQVLATATASSAKSFATEAIFNSTLNLKDLAFEENLFQMELNSAANIIYLVIFAFVFIFNLVMVIKSRYHWYNITFIIGYGLEFAGFLGRVLALSDNTNMNYYLLQIVCLTIAPAFIMGGVYFIFAQMVVLHGRQYSVLKPLWYSYFFIATDVSSLLIQAGGGGAASIASNRHTDTRPGTNTMLAGIVFQVVAMTIFLLFWFEFLNRLYFKNSKSIDSDSKLNKRSIPSYLKFLFNTPSARKFRYEHLERFYNPKFVAIRYRKLLNWYPLGITFAVACVYIRCVYRVVELAEGFSGYLITHEVYLMTLDSLMVALAGLTFVIFHPVFVIGSENVIRLATIKKNLDVEEEEEEADVEDLKSTLNLTANSKTN